MTETSLSDTSSASASATGPTSLEDSRVSLDSDNRHDNDIDQLEWQTLKFKLIKAMKNTRNLDIPYNMQWSKNSGHTLISGTCVLYPIGSLSFSSSSGSFVVPDLRSCSVLISVNPRQIDLFVGSATTHNYSITLQPSTESDWLNWSAGLLLWTSMRPGGSSFKSYTLPNRPIQPLIQRENDTSNGSIHNVTIGEKVIGGQVAEKFIGGQITDKFIKGQNISIENGSSVSISTSEMSGFGDNSSNKQTEIDSDDDLLICHCMAYLPNLQKSRKKKIASTNGNDPLPFRIQDRWQSSVAVLSKTGTLQLLDEDSGYLFLSVDTTKLSASNIRQVHYSVFEKEFIIFVRVEEGIIEDNLSAITHRTKKLFLRFAATGKYEDWFTALRAFSKKTIFADVSRDLSKSYRCARRFNLHVIEGKVSESARFQSVSSAVNADPSVVFFDSYIEVEVDGETWCRTSVNTSTIPLWKDTFSFNEFPTEGFTCKILLKRRLGPRIWSATDPIIGKIELLRKDLLRANGQEQWYTTKAKGDELDENKSEDRTLSLLMRIEYKEFPVLSESRYKCLQEELTDLSNCSAVNFSEIPQDISTTSDILLRFFMSENMAVEWINALIRNEVANMERKKHVRHSEGRKNLENTLFRANSVLTKTLEGYMNLIGHDYLKKVIGLFVQKVVENRAFLEIDPDRIPSTIQAQGNKTKSTEDFLEENRAKLKQYMQFLWKLIFSTLDEIPASFRIIFRNLRLSLSKLFAEKENTNELENEVAVNNAVSSFLFLRFFCPALLNPKLFGLVNQFPSPQVQRSLTLITKVMQSLANRVMFGSKEPWMVPMNKFLEEHRKETNKLFKYVTLSEEYDKETNGNQGQLDDFIVFEERPSKVSPLPCKMGQEPSNPYLIDRYETLAELVNFWHNKKDNWEPEPDGNPILAKVTVELDVLYDLTNKIYHQVNQPDTLDNANMETVANSVDLRYLPGKQLICLANAEFVRPPAPRARSIKSHNTSRTISSSPNNRNYPISPSFGNNGKSPRSFRWSSIIPGRKK